MAENESLDLGSSPRMRRVLDAVRNGSTSSEVASKLATALIGGLRSALKQFQRNGVTLADLLKRRDCPQAIRMLVRKVRGHIYARLFAEAATASGPTDRDCLSGWIDSVLDKFSDQICHRVAGSEHYPTVEDVQTFAAEVRDHIHPVVERLVTKFAQDPNSLPRQTPKKGDVPVNATVDLMNFSLLGAKRQ